MVQKALLPAQAILSTKINYGMPCPQGKEAA
jgi:hypothetical protein